MPKQIPELLINDMLESCEKIILYTKAMNFEQFVADDKTIDAVVRNFEIIGEAANRLPEEYKNTHNPIDWEQIRGFRNRIVDEYFGIDYNIIWQIIEKFLPEMIKILQKMK